MDNLNELPINDELSIPEWELTFSFSTSGGPGGQHANKAATRATLFYDVANSPSLTDTQRARIMKRLGSRIDQNGILQISVQETRSQHQNRTLALERFQELLQQALKRRKRRRRTKPPPWADERRLEQKKQRGRIKRQRSRDWFDKIE